METAKLKIPKSIKIPGYEVGDWVTKRIDKIKMTDITTVKDFSIYVKSRNEITVSHENKSQLNKFISKLKVIFKNSENKLKKAIT